MAKYIVARGQIEKGRDVIAKRGEPYTPKNAAEAKRLVASGAIVSDQNDEEDEQKDTAPKGNAKGGRQKSSGNGGGGETSGEGQAGE